MSKPERPYRKRAIGDRELQPETLVMSYGFDPHLSEGAIKPPIFQTSTFAFRSAEEGAAYFRRARGAMLDTDSSDADLGLAYTRINNPNLEVLEDRLTLYDGAEDALAFSSGMGAITTALMAFVEAGSVVVHSAPLYGATDTFLRSILPRFGVHSVEFVASEGEAGVQAAMDKARALGPVAVIFTETPGNPTNDLVDLQLCAQFRDQLAASQERAPVLMTDNTLLGPIGQAPIESGVDLVLYSLTKYVGGHSDLVAGAALGRADVVAPVRMMRTGLGTTPDPYTCWLVLRSLETVKLRMERAFANAHRCAAFLRDHPAVERVRFPAFLPQGSAERALYERQCRDAGSTFSFDVRGGQEAAFRVLDSLKLVKLAVSLGGTESLMCHPGSTTHSGLSPELQTRLGMTPGLLRISVGIEDPDDLIADLAQALAAVVADAPSTPA